MPLKRRWRSGERCGKTILVTECAVLRAYDLRALFLKKCLLRREENGNIRVTGGDDVKVTPLTLGSACSRIKRVKKRCLSTPKGVSSIQMDESIQRQEKSWDKLQIKWHWNFLKPKKNNKTDPEFVKGSIYLTKKGRFCNENDRHDRWNEL